VLTLSRDVWLQMLGHAYDGLPDEACGLLGGRRDRAHVFVPCANADRSSRTFSLGPDCWEAADRRIGDAGLDLVAVVHSHTHTEAYPSPTDVDEAANPLLGTDRWVVVSLRPPAPSVRSYRIQGATITEEPIDVLRR
jgi:proteasome lid subunit RPN8/RPN11